jgi:hypothetical protein
MGGYVLKVDMLTYVARRPFVQTLQEVPLSPMNNASQLTLNDWALWVRNSCWPLAPGMQTA